VWVWASLGSLAIAAGGAAAAIAATRDSASADTRTIIALSPLVKAPAPQPAKPARKKQRAKAGAAKAGAAKAKGAKAPPAHRRLIQWPQRNGYTIVLASIPLNRGIGPATAFAQRALKRGFQSVGVLVSSRYSGLHPGYYLVFTGVYDSVEEAQGKLPSVTPRFPTAYARQIAR
jgi:septal ring-binding cell division protein DamX